MHMSCSMDRADELKVKKEEIAQLVSEPILKFIRFLVIDDDAKLIKEKEYLVIEREINKFVGMKKMHCPMQVFLTTILPL